MRAWLLALSAAILGCAPGRVADIHAPSRAPFGSVGIVSDEDGATPAPASYAPQSDGIAPAIRYASLDKASCEAELVRRRIPFEPVASARGVVAPVRLTGPVSGVLYRSMLPEKKRKTAAIDILDCRLVLSLDDFAKKVLARHDIVEVVHYSVYRPAKIKGTGRRHAGALAIDAAIFKTRDGRKLDVEKDFHGRIGARPCPAPPDAPELQVIACEAADARLFNVILTPDYNRPHKNHFHMEVTAGVKWMFVR